MNRTMLSVLLLLCLATTATADEIVPIQPCRVLDTRNTVGVMPSGTQLDFSVRGTPGAAQGGAAGCGVPARATAILANVIAIAPNGTGHVLLWPYGTSAPSSSALNVTALQTTNDGLFGLLAPTTFPPSTPDLSLKGFGFSAYYAVDLTGYVEPSLATLSGQSTGVLFGNTLVLETRAGATVKAFAQPGTAFQVSWKLAIPAAVGSCVHLDGFWMDGSTSGESGLFQAVGLPVISSGFCGSDSATITTAAFHSPRSRRFLTFANAPYSPGAVVAGDTFIIQNGSGAFAGHNDEWVIWNGTDWHFDSPQDGDLGFDASTGVYYRYRALGSAEWRALQMTP